MRVSDDGDFLGVEFPAPVHAQFLKTYDLMTFDGKRLTPPELTKPLIRPLAEYTIAEVSTPDPVGQVRIAVEERLYVEDEFERTLFGVRDESELRDATAGRKRLVNLMIEFNRQNEKRFQEARRSTTYTDRVTYLLRPQDGGFRIVWDKTVSAKDEAEKVAIRGWVVPALQGIKFLSAKLDMGDSLEAPSRYITVYGEVTAATETPVDFEDRYLDVEVELLDDKGNQVASDKSIFKPGNVRRSTAARFSVVIPKTKAGNWGSLPGSTYRVRVGNARVGEYSDWFVPPFVQN